MNKHLTLMIALTLLLSITIISLFLIGTLQCSLAQNSGTNESGLIGSDATWKQTGSPYNLTGNISINTGATLTVEAGVTVNLNSYHITVNGALVAKGTNTNKIQINGASGTGPSMPPPAPNPYPFTYGINFTELSVGYNVQSGSGSIIENAIINATTMALESSPKINNDTINGYITSNGTALISNNIVAGEIDLTGPSTVLNNHISGSVLVQTDVIGGNIEDSSNTQGTAVISNNVITGGSINGIGISFLTAFTNNIIISGNTISNCGNSGIAAEGIGVIENNLITNNHDGIDIEGQNTVTNNTIDNNYIGIQQVSNFLSSIAYNNIQNNSYNFYLYQSVSGNVNATYNYWGTTNLTVISNSIYDNKNNSNLGTVNFVPFLAASHPQALPNPNAPIAPELSWLVILPLFISMLFIAVILRSRMTKSRNVDKHSSLSQGLLTVTLLSFQLHNRLLETWIVLTSI